MLGEHTEVDRRDEGVSCSQEGTDKHASKGSSDYDQRGHWVPRDNVVFEAGLFTGNLGRERVFYIVPENRTDARILSDLDGVTFSKFNENHGDKKAAMRPVYGRISELIINRGAAAIGDKPQELLRLIQEQVATLQMMAQTRPYWSAFRLSLEVTFAGYSAMPKKKYGSLATYSPMACLPRRASPANT